MYSISSLVVALLYCVFTVITHSEKIEIEITADTSYESCCVSRLNGDKLQLTYQVIEK